VSGEHEPNVILKDNDIKYKIRLPRHTTESLLTQIRADADFLYSIGVMDYSLLGKAVMSLIAVASMFFLGAIGIRLNRWLLLMHR
jgi:hypothetical protein